LEPGGKFTGYRRRGDNKAPDRLEKVQVGEAVFQALDVSGLLQQPWKLLDNPRGEVALAPLGVKVGGQSLRRLLGDLQVGQEDKLDRLKTDLAPEANQASPGDYKGAQPVGEPREELLRDAEDLDDLLFRDAAPGNADEPEKVSHHPGMGNRTKGKRWKGREVRLGTTGRGVR